MGERGNPNASEFGKHDDNGDVTKNRNLGTSNQAFAFQYQEPNTLYMKFFINLLQFYWQRIHALSYNLIVAPVS